jgi:hypothetical protein
MLGAAVFAGAVLILLLYSMSKEMSRVTKCPHCNRSVTVGDFVSHGCKHCGEGKPR